jgi:hypothetical protein
MTLLQLILISPLIWLVEALIIVTITGTSFLMDVKIIISILTLATIALLLTFIK